MVIKVRDDIWEFNYEGRRRKFRPVWGIKALVDELRRSLRVEEIPFTLPDVYFLIPPGRLLPFPYLQPDWQVDVEECCNLVRMKIRSPRHAKGGVVFEGILLREVGV